MDIRPADLDNDAKTIMSRGRLTRQVLSATTLTEVLAATQALADWIDAHLEDEGMSDAFEQLAMMQEIAEIQEAERHNTTAPPT